MTDLENVIEMTIEGFDNAVMNLPEAEKWLDDGGKLIFTFTKDETRVEKEENV